jgi:hypothetical protein
LQALKDNTVELEKFESYAFDLVRRWMYNPYCFALLERTEDFNDPGSPEINGVMGFFRVMQLAHYLLVKYLVIALCDMLAAEILKFLSRSAGHRTYAEDGPQMDEADKETGEPESPLVQEALHGTPPEDATYSLRMLNEHYEQISRLPPYLQRACETALVEVIPRDIHEAVTGRVFLFAPLRSLMRRNPEFASQLCLKLETDMKEILPLLDRLDALEKPEVS